jgi:hypothetical protein
MVIRSRRAISIPIVIFALVAIIAVAAIALAVESTARAPNPGGSSVLISSGTAALQRSGPISTYPAAWGVFSSCPGQPKTGNITTFSNLSTNPYPDSWNTTKVVSLGQVYQAIISSPTFMNTASGHGWVVSSWNFIPGASTNFPPNSPDIVAYFIMTNATSPNGYVWAFYDIQTGAVANSSLDTYAEFNCSSTTSSSTAGAAGADTVVATVTVTETLTTQASQATTSYAVPTNCNFTLPTATLTTTTITVWPTPPASTTTTTVTTTSTSYAQTVTVTSCTYIAPTVTSTSTTTATP